MEERINRIVAKVLQRLPRSGTTIYPRGGHSHTREGWNGRANVATTARSVWRSVRKRSPGQKRSRPFVDDAF
jgi:hypothetical protein